MKIADTKVKIVVGMFLIVVCGAGMAAVLFIGDGFGLVRRNYSYRVWFRDAGGLQEGAPVKMGGLTIGSVTDLHLEYVEGAPAAVATLQIVSPHNKLVRVNTRVHLHGQGVLGDKYAALAGGAADAQLAPVGSMLGHDAQPTLEDAADRATAVLNEVASVVRDIHRVTAVLPRSEEIEQIVFDVRSTVKSIHAASELLLSSNGLMAVIADPSTATKIREAVLNIETTGRALASTTQKIDRGKGTLGLLINDPELYDDTRSLLGRTNRSKFARNLVREVIHDRTYGSH